MSRFFEDNIPGHLGSFIGETVTIFTESGGESGRGFTGVVLFVNDCLVRLVTCIGPAPSCPLGNACDSGFFGPDNNCKCRNHNIRTVGSVVDIPTNKIVAFVHNATR
jgi:hypothetical protein